MNKTISVTLDEEGMQELQQIIFDDDKEGALAFLKTHFRSKVSHPGNTEGCAPDKITLQPESRDRNKR